MTVEFKSNSRSSRHEIRAGQIELIPLEPGQKATLTVAPAKGFDVGAGKGNTVEREVTGGVVGLILDARGRPIVLPADRATRVGKLTEWNHSLNMYPVT